MGYLINLVIKDERRMVVLDDVMTFTDKAGMAGVMSILEEEAECLQVIILTCHPERYRRLNDARFVDLESIVQSAAPLDY